MASSFSNSTPGAPQSDAAVEPQLSEESSPAEPEDVEPEQLLEADLELWLRHFGVC